MLVGACKHAAVLARRSNDFVHWHVAILTLEIGFESEAGPKTPSTLTFQVPNVPTLARQVPPHGLRPEVMHADGRERAVVGISSEA